MEPYPPPIAPDTDAARPTFCLSNARGATCPDDMLHSLGDAIAYAFGVQRDEIAHNRPFEGGWIIRHHAKREGIPWIQVEMNRALYLGPSWFDETQLTVDDSRIAELNSMFSAALERFVDELG
jgi:formiminoglutamase